MTIAQSFANYMETILAVGEVGEDIFIGAVPKGAPNKAWWVVTSGGFVDRKAETGEKIKVYALDVFYRNTDAQDVDEVMQLFEESVNNSGCDQLEDFDTLEMDAIVFQSDIDLDAEDRQVGLVRVNVKIYA